MFKGLSTNQAPPISVPFRFFLTAPLFGVLISVVLFLYPIDSIFNRYSPIAIGLIHLFTLGILAQIILGALQQMLPVLAGAVFPRPILFANIVHICLVVGTLGLSGGFIFSSQIFLSVGIVSLIISFGVFFTILIKLLFSVKYLNPTVKTMKLFSISGFITVVLGIFLATQYLSNIVNSYHYIFVNIHILFAFFGFGLLLVMGVAFQVIPMFYVAQDFPQNIQQKFPRVIFGMIIFFAIFSLFAQDTEAVKYILSSLTAIFGYYGLKSLNNRKRPVFDITLWYWKLSLYSLIISMGLFLFGNNINLTAIVVILGFLYPLLQGMIYKIIPFLAWFHLSAKGHFMIPNLRDYINSSNIKVQFYIYVVTVLFFVLSLYFNQLFLYVASSLFLVSNLLFLFNLLTAVKKYKDIIK